MSNYFIKYKNIAIHVFKKSKFSKYSYEVMTLGGDMEYEYLRLRYPYANCIKIDLGEQLYGKSLKRTLPFDIMDLICNIKEVKVLLRDEKLERILNNK